MVVFTKWIILLQFFDWLSAQSANSETLKSVQIMFRHGIREADLVVAQPTGRLTEDGKKQMYNLGLYYRERYDSLISRNYHEKEISIVSSDYDRTIQSASLVAYGLYKDFNFAADWSGGEEIQFEPIPVRTIPKELDKYIQLAATCPRRQEIQGKVTETYFTRYLQENADIVDYYYKHTGDETILDSSKGSRKRVNKMVVKQEEITMNLTNNLPVVDWAKPLLKNEAFLSVETAVLRQLVETVEQKRLNTGSLIQLFIENMEEPSDTRKKMHLFSGHDRTIVMLLNSLGIYDQLVLTMPPTGTSFILELHEAIDVEAKPFIQIWYRNETQISAHPHLLEIPNCGTPCYLSVFKNLVKDIVPFDFEAECTAVPVVDPMLNSISPTLKTMNIVFYTTVTICLLVMVGVFQILLIKRRRYETLMV